jgi:hypothetical protein
MVLLPSHLAAARVRRKMMACAFCDVICVASMPHRFRKFAEARKNVSQSPAYSQLLLAGLPITSWFLPPGVGRLYACAMWVTVRTQWFTLGRLQQIVDSSLAPVQMHDIGHITTNRGQEEGKNSIRSTKLIFQSLSSLCGGPDPSPWSKTPKTLGIRCFWRRRLPQGRLRFS